MNQLTKIHEDFLQESELDSHEINLSCLVTQIQASIHELLCTLCCHSSGLLFLAFRPESTSLLIKACLQTFSNIMLKDTMSNSKTVASNYLIFGLELIYKIEALRYLDLLIDWTRRKGLFMLNLNICIIKSIWIYLVYIYIYICSTAVNVERCKISKLSGHGHESCLIYNSA